MDTATVWNDEVSVPMTHRMYQTPDECFGAVLDVESRWPRLGMCCGGVVRELCKVKYLATLTC